jgi:phosphoenolpyruvate carboxykinase (ATP)
MKLKYTRAMITAALNGELDNVGFEVHEVFGLAKPQSCPNVPDEVLSPRGTWNNDEGYYEKADKLAKFFQDNFKQFEEFANDEIMEGAPVVR